MTEERIGEAYELGEQLTVVGRKLDVGKPAPGFELDHFDGDTISTVRLSDSAGSVRLLNVVNSLDTPVCSQQTKKFDESLASLKDQVACYTVSLDMPFAQKRFCTAENVQNMQTLSDVHNHSFGQAFGVLIEGLPLPLLSRAVFVVDKNGTITYAEYVPEVTSHPNYDQAAAALKAAL